MASYLRDILGTSGHAILNTQTSGDCVEGYLSAVQRLRVTPVNGAKIVYTPLHGVGGPWLEKVFVDAGMTLFPFQNRINRMETFLRYLSQSRRKRCNGFGKRTSSPSTG